MTNIIIEKAKQRYAKLLDEASAADIRALLVYWRARIAARENGTLEDFERRARPTGMVAELIEAQEALQQTRAELESFVL